MEAWEDFLKVLDKTVARRFNKRLPATLKELAGLGLPVEVTGALLPILGQGWEEASLVRALLHVLPDFMPTSYAPATLAFLAALPAGDPRLLVAVRTALAQVDAAVWKESPAAESSDIPAFLR
jgi:hypothetical protein